MNSELLATEQKGVPRLGFSLKETAYTLGTSYASVLRLIDRGLLKPSRALRTTIVPRTEVERFLRETSK